jgi:hypothetical protein
LENHWKYFAPATPCWKQSIAPPYLLYIADIWRILATP